MPSVAHLLVWGSSAVGSNFCSCSFAVAEEGEGSCSFDASPQTLSCGRRVVAVSGEYRYPGAGRSAVVTRVVAGAVQLNPLPLTLGTCLAVPAARGSEFAAARRRAVMKAATAAPDSTPAADRR